MRNKTNAKTLADAEVRGVNLADANIQSMDMSLVDSGESLTITDLRGTNLSGADLANVNLSRADV